MVNYSEESWENLAREHSLVVVVLGVVVVVVAAAAANAAVVFWGFFIREPITKDIFKKHFKKKNV